MCFKINWASLIVGRKFTIFALFYLVFEGNFQVQAPTGLIILLYGGQFNGGFFVFQVWGAYIWRCSSNLRRVDFLAGQATFKAY